MATNSSIQRPPTSRTDTIPGAFPASPAPGEPPTIVSSQLSLSQAVHERKAEYTRSRRIKVKVGTWNVASLSGTEKDIGGWFVEGKGVLESVSALTLEGDGLEKQIQKADTRIESIESQEGRRSKKKPTLPENDPGLLPGGEEIGIYALGLQEIVDISSVAEALRPFSDPHPANKWRHSVSTALPRGYKLIAEQQLLGLYLVVYASSAIAPSISSISTTSVGTGLGGYMGNKGAVTTRIVIGETTRMVFINCHLSAGAEKGSLERRNWDASQILSRTKFDPVYDGGGVMEEFGESIGDEDFAFWFGDLNYRLEDIPGEDVRRLLMLHTRNSYGKAQPSKQKIEHELANPESSTFHENLEAASRLSTDDRLSSSKAVESPADRSVASSYTLTGQEPPDPSTDPASLQTTLSSLLTHDQLHAQMRTRKAFHDGWREGPVDFLPTYKYDVGSVGMFDSSEKRRGPSWCDRILYRTRKDKLDYEERVKQEEASKEKDAEMKLRGVVEAATDEAVLFDYDPETDGADDQNDSPTSESPIVVTKSGFEDRIHLDYYTSHQRVISSDHKPLVAGFTLKYDAVDPDLKAKVHQEVARDLDKAENEGRPVVTIVVDHHRDIDITQSDLSRSKYEGVDFGDVKYDHVKIRNVTIANTGRVPAVVGFVDRSTHNEQPGGVSPPWLSIRFDRPSLHRNPNPGALQEFNLEPGDAANVELTVHVTDLKLVHRLTEGEESLEDVLVLRIQNGRDYFLPIRGHWLQSAFGRSIEKLVRIPEGGVRRLQHQKPEGSTQSGHGHRSDNEKDAVKWSAPREIFRLTEAIESLVERSLAEWGMKGEEGKAPWETDPGWPFAGCSTQEQARGVLRERVREGLDTNTPFTELFALESGSIARLEAMAETLVQFLKSLPDGIIPDELWIELEKGMLETEKTKATLSDEEERMWILDTISSAPAHSVSFTFVTFMLSRVANETAPVAQQLQRRVTATSFDDMEAVQRTKDDSARKRRREVDDKYAAIFAEAMIRLPETLTGRGRKVSEARRKRVVDVFLHSRLDNGS